ncbi:C6 zinc finger protein [Colletotrichum plurivorum]|uniref:C6 zinc finger protein n=1 Tax=Colletotrichum plurivorum TaxID=2175906 RepID=A0A8H6K395_9PEZI|nr:C6 zinc finger protein [Colletotrichum plurivorum]
MARKGSRKTRTGCITCKIRKIKCDEAKPACNRCTVTGRHCDGYLPADATQAMPAVSDLRLQRPDDFPGIGSAAETRALQYFCESAGPHLSGVVDPYFLSKLVMQFASYEPAARHSVVSLSTLCERLYNGGDPDEVVNLRDGQCHFALRHYSAGMREISRMTSADNRPVVLLVCILFIGIELLQSNMDTVRTHCRHGFAILRQTTSEYAWTRQHLLPLFRRLSIMGFLYADDPRDFPDIEGLEHPVPDAFLTFSDAQIMIDDVYSRVVRLVRRADPYRIDPQTNGPPPPEMVAEQDNLKSAMEQWWSLFEEFQNRPASPPGRDSPGTQNLTSTLRYALLSRYESCKVWLNTALGAVDYDYSTHWKAFDQMFEDLGIADAEFRRSFRRSPGFISDDGYVPTITLSLTRCAHLEERLAMLKLEPVPNLPRENLCQKAHAGGCNLLFSTPPQVIGSPTELVNSPPVNSAPVSAGGSPT